MTGSKQRDKAADTSPEAPVTQVTGVGLSPAVEKMFGALVDEQAAGARPGAEPEARRAARPGAA